MRVRQPGNACGRGAAGRAPSSHAPASPRRRCRAPPSAPPPPRRRAVVPSALSSSPPAPSSALVSFGFRRDLDEMVSQGSILGAGTYGVVRCATLLPGAFLPGLPPGAAPPSPDSGPLLAVKRVPKHLPRVSGAVLESYRNKIRSEAATHSRLSASLSVVTLYGCFEDEQAVYFLMQRCTGGSLWACPELRPGGGGGADNDDGAGAAAGGPSEAGVAAVLRHVLRALSQCHAAGVCFRDVKPDAFLRASDDPHSPLLLSDFGLAARVPPAGVLTERCGTAAYCAPEVLAQRYGVAADMWSAGVLAYQLLAGRLPFAGDSQKELFCAVLHGRADFKAPPWPARSPASRDFVGRLLAREPGRRMDAAQALAHGWCRPGGLARGGPMDAEPAAAAAAGAPAAAPGRGAAAAGPAAAPESAVAALQRFATAGALRRALLRRLAAAAEAAPASAPAAAAAAAAVVAPVHALFDALAARSPLAPAAAGAAVVRTCDLIEELTVEGYHLTPAEWAALLPVGPTISRPELVARLADWRALGGGGGCGSGGGDAGGGAGAAAAWAAWAAAALAAGPPPTPDGLADEACAAPDGWWGPEGGAGGFGGGDDAAAAARRLQQQQQQQLGGGCRDEVARDLAAAGGGEGGGGGDAAAVGAERWAALLHAAAAEGAAAAYESGLGAGDG